MFKGDYNLVVDAVTVDGRHVDPFSQVSSPRYPMPGETIPPAMGPNWLFYQYAARLESHGEYRQAFQEWILRYPERTGRPEDHIVSFRAFIVQDDSPPPGEREPRNSRSKLMFEYSGQ